MLDSKSREVKKILYIGDIPDNHHLYKLILRKSQLNIDFRISITVEDAYQAVCQEKPDLIMLDSNRLDAEDKKFLETINGPGVSGHTPVIILSAVRMQIYDDQMVVPSWTHELCDEFLSKPTDIDRLLHTVCRLLYSAPVQFPHRCPYCFVSLVGREHELAWLADVIQPGSVTLLYGPSGIGKTILATEAIWTIMPAHLGRLFPDGVVAHDFELQPSTTSAFESICSAFGEELISSPEDAAKRALANRRALIFLDNVDATDDLEGVLKVCRECGVLATSRTVDTVRTSNQIVIPPLSLDEASSLLQTRARRKWRDRKTTQQICELVGCLPLAIHLAGCYLREAPHYLYPPPTDAGAEVTESRTDASYLSWLRSSPLELLGQEERLSRSVPLLIEHSLAQVSEKAREAFSIAGTLPFGSSLKWQIAKAQALDSRDSSRLSKILDELWHFGLVINHSFQSSTYEYGYYINHRLVYEYTRAKAKPS